MQLTIEIPNEQLLNKILLFLNRFKSDGLKIISDTKESLTQVKKSSNSDLDFSSFKVDSFKDVDGLNYQKKIRDEW